MQLKLKYAIFHFVELIIVVPKGKLNLLFQCIRIFFLAAAAAPNSVAVAVAVTITVVVVAIAAKAYALFLHRRSHYYLLLHLGSVLLLLALFCWHFTEILLSLINI